MQLVGFKFDITENLDDARSASDVPEILASVTSHLLLAASKLWSANLL